MTGYVPEVDVVGYASRPPWLPNRSPSLVPRMWRGRYVCDRGKADRGMADDDTTDGAREPTLPLPAQTGRPPEPRARGPEWLRSGAPQIVAAVVLVALAFVVGMFVGREVLNEENGSRQSEAAPARELERIGRCGRALESAAELVAVQREALKNRASYTRALAEGDQDELKDLNATLRGLVERAAEIEPKVTRGLAACPG